MPRVLVIGQGNVLLGDEALGPEVVRLLESRYELPPGVEVLEIGTQGLDLVPFLHDAEAVISVNSLHGVGAPGEVRVLDRAAILAADAEYRMSPHAFGLKGHLLTLEFSGAGPRQAWVVGAIPLDVELRSGLSRTMKMAVAPVLAEVLNLLALLGAAPTPRETPLPLDLWWDKPV